MGLAYSQIADAVLLTQNKMIKRGAFVDMQTDLTDHVAVREMWKNRQTQFDGGTEWEFEVQIDHNYSFRFVGLYETDGTVLQDTMIKGSVPVRHANASYIYDLREKAFQRGGTAIVNYIKTKYVAMMASLFEGLEPVLWSKPDDSNDVKTPFGISYWVTRSATEGFNGVDPVGFASGRAGISSTTYSRFANRTGQYVDVSDTDLLRKMSTAHRKTQFRSIQSHSTPEFRDMQNGIYANSDTIGLMESQLRAQNMNLGNDLASKYGMTMFKGTPVTYVPYLDADSTDPVYMLDWRTLTIGVMAGWESNLTPPHDVANMHLVKRVDLDLSLNMVCTDPRRQTVLYK